MDKEELKRKKAEEEKGSEEEAEVTVVSAGPVDKALELAFNPTREKLREVTIIDRIQGRLLPQLDIIDAMWQYFVEIATYRHDKDNYTVLYKKPQPVPPNLLDEFMHRTAQWQKSVGGINLTKITDIALAEMETKAGDDDGLPGSADWKD